MIHPVARIPDAWIEQARDEGAHIDLSLKSPWKFFAAWDKSEPLGFIGVLLRKNRATIRGWYVFPEYRDLMIGTELLQRAIKQCVEDGLEKVEIRTAHNVEWAGFVWTGYERSGGNKERHYVLELERHGREA